MAEVLNYRITKISQEYKRARLEMEDEDLMYKNITENIIGVKDPSIYRKKIKGFTAGFGIRDK